jgi:HAD superfamily hydrolase (TIGR01509 family)
MALEAIIFDFDGVIIDTETPDYEVWQTLYQSHGLDLSMDLWLNRTGFDVTSTAFDPARHFHELTGNELAQAVLQAQHQAYLDRCAAQPLLDGVAETLQTARQLGLKLGIASNSDHKWVDRWLNQHDLMQYFDCVRCRDDVKAGKPAPDLYLSAAKCLGVSVDRCLAVEDSPTGMKATLAAGIRCVAIPNQMTARLNRPEVALTLSSLAELDLQKLLSQF